MSFGKFNNNNNKKKSKKTKSKPNVSKNSEQSLLQFSEFENDDKTTTDAEFLNKKPLKPSLAKKQSSINNNQNSNIIIDFEDNNIDDNNQIKTEKQKKLPSSTFINTDDFDLSLSDNDIDYGQEEIKDTTLKPSSSASSEPKVTFSKIKEKQSKSNSIIPNKSEMNKKTPLPNTNNEMNNQKMKAQGKKEPNSSFKPKKKAGSEMTMQSYGSSSKTQDLIEKNIQLSSDITNVGRNALSNSFYYNDEKMLQINSLLSNMIQFIKSNPYYIFASAVATACSKTETYFIRNSAQELIKIITSNGRNAISSSGLDKSFEQQLGVLKSINHLLTSMNPELRFVGYTKRASIDVESPSSSVDLSTIHSGEIISDAEKLLRKNLAKIKILQTEIDTIRNIIIKGNIFLSLEFYLSQDLISLVNTVITNVQLLPDDNGFVSPRSYDPNKIIEYKPMIRNKLAELCALTYSNYSMINAARPTTKFLHVSAKNIYNENMLILKKMLESDDDVLDDGYNRISLVNRPNMDYSYLSPSPSSSPYASPYIQSQQTIESERILERPPVFEERSPFTSSFSPSELLNLEPYPSQQGQSKKKRMLASSKKYYSVPKRFRI